MKTHSRDACTAKFCQAIHDFCLRTNKGRRSVGRRTDHCPHHRMRKRTHRNELASRRSTAVLVRLLPLAQLRAALPGITECKREKPPRCSELPVDRS
jgi:hypothetical protein